MSDYPYKENYWETKDHIVMPIYKMDDNHIKNTINFLERHRDFYDECYGDFLWESYDYEDNSHLVDKKIEELKNELKRREKTWMK